MLRLHSSPWSRIDPTTWDAFVGRSPQGSVYMQSWFLSAVAKEGTVHVVEDGEGWLAALFLPSGRRYRFLKGAFAPPFWRYGGILWRASAVPLRRRLKAAALLAAAAAAVKRHDWTAHPASDFWLPFVQRGFEVRARYTFRLPLRPWPRMLADFQPRLRTTLRKPLPDGHAIASIPWQEAAALLRRIGPRSVGISGKAFDVLPEIVRQGMAHHALTITGYRIKSEWKGLVITIRDHHTLYQLLPVVDKAARWPIHPWLLRAVFQQAYRTGQTHIDFVGSHIPGVVSFIAKFAPTPIVYWHVTKA